MEEISKLFMNTSSGHGHNCRSPSLLFFFFLPAHWKRIRATFCFCDREQLSPKVSQILLWDWGLWELQGLTSLSSVPWSLAENTTVFFLPPCKKDIPLPWSFFLCGEGVGNSCCVKPGCYCKVCAKFVEGALDSPQALSGGLEATKPVEWELVLGTGSQVLCKSRWTTE